MEGPRIRGIQEHLARAQFLFDAACNTTEAIASYRFLLASIYSCRAITELMLEAAEKQQVTDPEDPTVKWSREELEAHVSPKLAFYSLIERIRIHDFHRFGLVPPNPTKYEVFLGGPGKLVAQQGAAVLGIGPHGPVQSVTGQSQVKMQRPLLTRDGEFYDEESSKYVSLKMVVEQFLSSAHVVVGEFSMSGRADG